MANAVTLEKLRAAGVGLKAPFQLSVPGKEPLECRQVYRHLPGKRVVFRARWSGADTLVKLFFQEKYFSREKSGLEALAESGVPHPKKIWSLKDDGGYFLATEYLDDSASLESCYQGLSFSQLQPLLKDALACIGQLHRAGWMQEDIHLDNFLLSNGNLHVIDGGGIAPVKDTRQKLDNLGLFFAQMVPDYDVLAPQVIAAYGQDAPEEDELLQAIGRMREKRIRHYIGKAVRTCTQFEVARSAGSFVAIGRQFATEKLKKIMGEPDVAVGHGDFLKQGNTATVVKIVGDRSEWVLKRYNIKDFWHWVSRCWRPSRAWVSWQNAYRLELLGIATPQPLAMRENRNGPFRREAYLLTEYAAGEDLRNWVLRQSDQPVPQWLGDQVERMFDIFWRARIAHGDMKATNLMVVGEQLQVLDLDSLAWHRTEKSFKKAYARDLQRFMDNWQGKTWRYFADLLTPFAERVGTVLKNNKV